MHHRPEDTRADKIAKLEGILPYFLEVKDVDIVKAKLEEIKTTEEAAKEEKLILADPQWVKSIAAVTSKLEIVRDGYDQYVANLGSTKPRFGPILHHLFIGTTVWAAFTYMPYMGIGGEVLAYFVPFMLYIPLQCYNPELGPKHKDHHGHHHKHEPDYTKTHPTAVVVGSTLGAISLCILYSPLVQSTEFIITAQAYVALFMEGAFGMHSPSAMPLAMSAMAIIATAVVGAAVTSIAQAASAQAYDAVLEKYNKHYYIEHA